MEYRGQLLQDKWVLSWFPPGYKGFFLDVGMCDAIRINNTYLLEQLGWRGIGIDPYPTNVDKRPNLIVEEIAVFSEETELSFIEAGPLGGAADFVDLHAQAIKDKPRTTVKTTTLAAILKKHDAPNIIDYMSLDTEGTEYEVLRVFPFEEYAFGCITVEHNHERLKRERIHALLTSKGYVREQRVRFDDWYIHASMKR